MPDWTKGMQQTFTYYEVDPVSWTYKRPINTIIKSDITRSSGAETLQTATIDSTEEFGEMYIRINLKTIQNGIEEETSLGTFLIQTPSDSFDGKIHTFSYDAYSPLLELKDSMPPIGYFIPKGTNVMAIAAALCEENCRAPVIPPMEASPTTLVENFVAEDSDTWLSFLSDLISLAGYKFDLDETSRIIFQPATETRALQPMYIFNDDNSSILYPDLSMKRDLYGIPNAVEVVYTNSYSSTSYIKVVNDDPGSPTSTVSRGREILHRETNPSLNGTPTAAEMNEYAKKMLVDLSTLEYTVDYRHGYCPIRLGECALLNYELAGFENVKVRVTDQKISCEPGCPVDETGVYSVALWEG